MTIHRIKLKNLTQAYIDQLKEKASDGEQEITIWLSQKSTALPEDEFWYILSLLDWQQSTTKKILAPALKYLTQCSIEKIESFYDLLSEKLFLLDTELVAQQIGKPAYRGEDHPFSVDGFLYARCLAVAKGKDRYESILTDPKNMIKDDTFEPLLSLPYLAYEQKTGKPFDYIPAYLFETFSNPDGWDGEDLLSNILGDRNATL